MTFTLPAHRRFLVLCHCQECQETREIDNLKSIAVFVLGEVVASINFRIFLFHVYSN